jgi:Big-like domain-containing protein
MTRVLRNVPSRRKLAMLITLVASTGCTLNTDVSGPAAIINFSGDQQSAPTNTALPAPLVVLVVSQFGQPVQNVTVTWTIVSGAGSLGAGSTQTDSNGLASATYTTGPTAGAAVIRARVSGVPAITFNITIT